MTATQAPTPGPLSGDDVNRECKACGAFKPDLNAACTFCGLAPTAPVEASGSEREDWKQRLAGIQIGRSVDDIYSAFPFPEASFRGDIGHALSALRPQPSGETREAVARIVAAEFLRQDYEPDAKPEDVKFSDGLSWSYVDQGSVDFGEIADRVIAYFDARPLALVGQQGEEGEVQYEVWGAGPQGDFCAGSDTLSDAQHYAAVYGQDGPVVIKVATTTRVDWSEASSALSTTPARAEAQDEDTPCTDCGDTGVTHQTERRCSCQEAEAQDEGAAGEPVAWVDPTDIDTIAEGYPMTTQIFPAKQADAAATMALYAHPSPTPAADADRLRIPEKWVDVAEYATERGLTVHESKMRLEEFQRVVTPQALAALKSTAAKEGGAL